MQIIGTILKKSPKTFFFVHLGPNFFFRKTWLLYIWGTIVTHLCTKNQKKLMTKSRENSIKPYFWSILCPNWAKLAPIFFSKIGLCYIRGTMVTRKPISRKPYNRRMDGRTDWRTDGETDERTNTGQFIEPPGGRSKKLQECGVLKFFSISYFKFLFQINSHMLKNTYQT